MLNGKNIIIGVTGSIAAYKAALLIRLLVKQGANVRVIMTPDAHDFITPLTLATLSKSQVLSSFTANSETGVWNNHVDLGLWADAMLIAPATANTLAKMANGLCDNLLLATYLSARCKVLVAPAMDFDMYKHPSTQQNLKTLQAHNVTIIPAESGELASGLEGEGRLAEPETILHYLYIAFQEQSLKGKKILISAGPTYEAIDPVRYIGNHSSGKMGIALAHAAAYKGAEVCLVCGPTKENIQNNLLHKIIHITSAKEMAEACFQESQNADIIIMSAAVADYSPKSVASEKIKKQSSQIHVELEATTDILAHLGNHKKVNQILVGFALETENEKKNALKKLDKKNLDIIVLNSLKDKEAGFSYDTNRVQLFFANNKSIQFELKPKVELAYDILHEIENLLV